MRGFLVLCLVAASTAAQLGYNYQQIGHNAEIGGRLLGGAIDNDNGRVVAVGDNISGGGGIAAGADGGFGGFAGVNDASGNYAQNGFASNINNDNNDNNNNNINNGGLGFEQSAPVAASEYNKEFYTYSAPEEEFNDQGGSQRIAATLKKNLRVVFIKAPENQALTNAALQLAKQASDDRTAIYVLNKQSDIGDLANQLQSFKSNQANRPEVHFVKYRTPEDAARAQQIIQSQYESLGGESHNSNEGVAKVLNFASPAAVSHVGASSALGSAQSSGSGLTSTGAVSNSNFGVGKNGYLPPALRLK